MTGEYRNGKRDDDRLCNLREVSNRENLCNLIKHRNGHLPGTTFKKEHRKWLSSIRANGKRIHLGYFKSAKLAHAAYVKAKNEIERRKEGKS